MTGGGDAVAVPVNGLVPTVVAASSVEVMVERFGGTHHRWL
jgi:hypothetical protein